MPRPRSAAPIPSLTSELVEVLDANDTPIAHLPLASAVYQKLPFRLACVALRDTHGRVHLRKRPKGDLGHHGVWDIYSAPVPAGYSGKDTALAVLSEQARVENIQPEETARRSATREHPAHLILYIAPLPKGVLAPPETETLAVDADELAGLVRGTPELLTPELIWAESTGLLFGKNT